MRIWDLPPRILCRQHLLGEHRELHGLWNILTKGHHGYASHPETKRWVGKQAALYLRHQQIVSVMQERGYVHASPLNPKLATGERRQRVRLLSVQKQKELLAEKGCDCRVKTES